MLFSPCTKPDATLFIKFSTDIALQDDNICLVGPFNLAPPLGATKASALIERVFWDKLVENAGIIDCSPSTGPRP